MGDIAVIQNRHHDINNRNQLGIQEYIFNDEHPQNIKYNYFIQ